MFFFNLGTMITNALTKYLSRPSIFCFLLKYNQRILALICLVVSLSSCNLFPEKKDHPALTDQLIKCATTLAEGTDRQVADFRFLDSSYARIPHPGAGDYWKKYYFKQKSYYFTGRANKDRKQLEMSLVYADSMLFVIKNTHAVQNYQQELSIANFSIGDVLFEMGQYENAYQFFYQGKVLANQSKDKCSQAFFDSRFAVLNYKQGRFKHAASLFMQTYADQLSCSMNFDTFAATQGALDNAGMSYSRAGMADSAIICYNKALDFIDDKGRLFPDNQRFILDARGVIYGNLGEIYKDRGQIVLAEKFFKESIELTSTDGAERRFSQPIQLMLARLYLENGRIAEADTIINKARLSLNELPNEEAELEWQKIRWNYYGAIKELQKANPYLLAYLKLKDSADARKLKLNIADAGGGFNQIQKKYEIEILKREKELNFVYLIITLAFSLIVIFIVIQTWRNWKNSRVKNESLMQLNQQIIRQNDLMKNGLNTLEQSQEENTKIMHIVAHDLRSPISSITSLANLMLDETPQPEELKMMLAMIKTSGENSLTLVNDILQSNPHAIELVKELVDLKSMLQYCVDLLFFKAEAKAQQILLDAEQLTVLINGHKMWRVLSNLIANAIKFSPAGATIEVKMKKETGLVIISVQDHGIGIPDDMKDKLFDIFGETKRYGTAGEQPFGLGLAISKQIVKAHNGEIWFESNEGEGTTFFVALPLL